MDKNILSKATALSNTIYDLENKLIDWEKVSFDGENYVTSDADSVLLTESDFTFIKEYIINKLEKELSKAREEFDNL